MFADDELNFGQIESDCKSIADLNPEEFAEFQKDPKTLVKDEKAQVKQCLFYFHHNYTHKLDCKFQ